MILKECVPGQSLVRGHTSALKNGENVILDVPPRIVNGRTLVPLRFVGEALGADVTWDDVARRVTIASETSQPNIPQEPGSPSQPAQSPLLPDVSMQLPEWVKSNLKHSFVEKKFDSALIYTEKISVKPLGKVSLVYKDLTYMQPWHRLPQVICWNTGCDYSPYMILTGNQDGAGGCIGRSMIHVMLSTMRTFPPTGQVQHMLTQPGSM